MVTKRPAFEHFRPIAAALATVLAIGVCPDLAFAVVYTNVTGTIASGFSGINHVQHPGNNTEVGLFRTGGAAAGDFDNDGWVDLFATRLNARPLLYRNLGNGTFQDVAVAAGFTSSLPANGPAWGDIDNDGDRDLYVTSSGGTRFYLYVNNGNGTFTEQAVARGAAISGVVRYGQSATFGDYDGDGYLDIHTNDWATDTSLSTSRLLRNLGTANPGHFEDVTAAAGLDVFRPSHTQGGGTDSNAYRYSSTFTDLDRDGHPDLTIAADFLTSQIFWNNGDGTFTDGTAAAGVGTDEDGMGSTIGDFDGDGLMDWFVSALVDVPGGFEPHSGNRLFRNNGDRTFTDQTDLAGVRDSGWSWGTTFLDHDNDRDLDLIVTNGWDTMSSDQSHLYRNDNGIFTDISNAAGVTDTGMGRGLLSFDYDNDGDLDVFIVNHGAQPILYRNDGGNDNDWLKIKLEGTESNRDGIGAFITVDPDISVDGDEIVREINAGSNFLSQNDLTAHFGLGPNSGNVDLITIVWPGGATQELTSISPNQVLNLVEDAALPGDYNHNLIVDAADYVVWRNQLGSTGAGLAADGNGDSMVTQLDYDIWKANFGIVAVGSGSKSQFAPVPEPSTALLLVVGAFIVVTVSRRGSTRRRCLEDILEMKRALVLAGALMSVWVSPVLSDDEPSNEPKPIPVTRPELKAALEALKERQPRVGLPVPVEGEASVEDGGMRVDYLPETWGLGGFGYHNIHGARGRIGQGPNGRLDDLFTDQSFWIVSRVNNCHYCLGHQELKLRAAGLDDDMIAAIDSDWSQFDLRQQAALAYARELTLEPQLVDDQEIAALKKLFTDAEIVEMTYNIALFNSANRWTDGMGFPQERHFSDHDEETLNTPTSEHFRNSKSIVIPTTRKSRPALATLAQIQQAIAATRHRAPRVTLTTVEAARRELADVIGDREPYEWERALSRLPVNGKAQVKTWNTILSDDNLTPRLKAELAFVTAVNNQAWYALAHAANRLKQLGASPQDLTSLLDEQERSRDNAETAYRLAAKSTIDPHLITDADIALVRGHYSDAETAQIMQVICMANMFDRFTEALGLPLEKGIADELSPSP